MLRPYSNYDGKDWNTKLPLYEFALNDSVNSSTGFSPFYLTYGYNLRQIPSIQQLPPGIQPIDFIEKTYSILEMARANLCRSQERMFNNANKHRQIGIPLEVGDKVLLKREGINFQVYDGSKEHQCPLCLGPFKIEEKIGHSQYKLELPPTLSRIHPIFHRERLFLYKVPTVKYPTRTTHEQPPMDPLTHESKVEEIIDKRKHYNKIQYLVQWKGYGNDDRTWEPIEHLENCQELLNEFESKLRSGGDVLKLQKDRKFGFKELKP